MREQLERALFATQREKILCFEAWKLYLNDPDDPEADIAWRRYVLASMKCRLVVKAARRLGLWEPTGDVESAEPSEEESVIDSSIVRFAAEPRSYVVEQFLALEDTV